MNFANFIQGLLIAAVGFLLVWKSNWLLNNFGRIGWAEQHLGSEGGSRLMYKLLGFIIIVAGFFYATNLGGIFIKWIANSLFGANIS
jgi:hypothetical protein